MTSRRSLCGAIAGVAFAAAAAAAEPEAWPTRAMQVISPFTAGNANDTVARVVLDQVSRQLGQPFVIENKPGGGGTIGPAMVAKAAPDGYTILLHSSSLSSQVVLHRTLPYDPIRDFTPVVMFGIQPNVLVAAPSTGFKTVADLVAAAKARPGALTFASAGIGSASHMAGERLRLAAGINVQHIPFRGAEGLAEVMAGRIDFYFVPIAPAVPVIADGKVVVLAVSTPRAGTRLAERADDCRSRLSRRGISILGRIVGAAEDASLHRQQAARRDPKGAGHADHPGTTGEARRPAAADERRAI